SATICEGTVWSTNVAACACRGAAGGGACAMVVAGVRVVAVWGGVVPEPVQAMSGISAKSPQDEPRRFRSRIMAFLLRDGRRPLGGHHFREPPLLAEARGRGIPWKIVRRCRNTIDPFPRVL